MFQSNYGSDSDFPLLLKLDDDLFGSLQESENDIRFLTLASFLMQRYGNTFADVVGIVGQIFQSFSLHLLFSAEIIYLLDKHWKQQEKTLLLLAYMCCTLNDGTYTDYNNVRAKGR